MQPDALQIGLVEDDPVMGGSIAQRLEIEGYRVNWWKTAGEAIASAELDGLDLIVCDIRLPDMNGEDLFRRTQRKRSTPPFLFITGFGEIDQAVRLMRLGAVDYVTKPFEFEDFLFRLKRNARSKPAPSADAQATGERRCVFGPSTEMIAVEELLGKYGTTDLPVLITGETGVGKEVAARFLHSIAHSDDRPFMAVNCAAIPADLLESEIFGHERGAFTGASKRHTGYAERAGKGSLFLDEIGDMPVGLQTKILRLIEEKVFYRLGGEEPVPFRARVITATHQDLSNSSGPAGFREDLYYRLSVLPVRIPPLRDRPDDVLWLTDRLVSLAASGQGKPVAGLSASAEELAVAHNWPGNVRELRNRIERAVAVSSGEWLLPDDLFPDLRDTPVAADRFSTLQEIRDRAEQRQIERALSQTSGRVLEAARLLKISRTTLWEKMTRFGIGADNRSDS